MSSGDDSILIFHRDRATQRVLQRALGSTLRRIDFVGSMADAELALCERRPSLVVIDGDLSHEAGFANLLVETDGHGAAGCLVLAAGGPCDAAGMIARGAVRHLLGSTMPALAEELATSAHKLLRGDLFGLEKYLAWGTEIRELEVVATSDRQRAVGQVAASMVPMGLASRYQRQAMLVVDELISNAVYNAPLDDHGARYMREVPREQHLVLRELDRPRLRWGSDGRYLAVEVDDRFGSITPATIYEHLGKTASRTGEIRLDGAGAGLGLAMAYSASSQLVFNVDPGARTQVIALIDLRARAQNANLPVSSFHLFSTGGARG